MFIDTYGDGVARDCTRPFVMHAFEANLCTEAYSSPDAVFGGYKVGETFAHKGEACERSNIYDCRLEQDVNENFRG